MIHYTASNTFKKCTLFSIFADKLYIFTKNIHSDLALKSLNSTEQDKKKTMNIAVIKIQKGKKLLL